MDAPLSSEEWRRLFRELFSKGIWVRMWEPLCFHTTIRIGGQAALFAYPPDAQKLVEVLSVLRNTNVPFKVLGAGSNTVPPDGNLEMAVVSLSHMSRLDISDEYVTAEAGVPLFKLVNTCMVEGLSGLEFLAGIPGSVGGAVRMNAGAFGYSVAHALVEVCVLDEKGSRFTLPPQEAKFGYRRSVFFEKDWTVISAKFRLARSSPTTVRKSMLSYLEKRLATQPLELPSAGSVFKRPRDGFYVGKAVEELGLKAYRIGGAAISEKHAGFIVNLGGATYEDVVALVRLVKKRIKERYDVDLETEVEFWGEPP